MSRTLSVSRIDLVNPLRLSTVSSATAVYALRRQHVRQQQHEEDEGPVRRGDGTILQESDKPRNPKKKMWEENVESEKYEQQQQAQQHAQRHTDAGSETGQGARERDEL